MKLLPKLLLSYSLILSFGLIVFGIVTSRSNSALIFPLLLLPVVVFLAITAIKHSDVQAVEKRKKELLSFGLVLLILIFMGVSNIQSSQINSKAPEIEQTHQSPIILETGNDEVELNKAQITIPEKTYISVYSEPDANSDEVAKVYDGEIVKYSAKYGFWYELVLNDELKGFVHEDNIVLSE